MPDVTTGQIGHWNFTEGTGLTVADISGYGKNGTLVGFTGQFWIEGQRNLYSVDFDGTDDYIQTRAGSHLLTGSNDFSFFVRFRLDPASTDRNDLIVWKTNDASKGISLHTDLSVSTKLVFFADTGTGAAQIIGTTTLNKNQWYDAAVTKIGNNYVLYLDGVSEGSTNNPNITLSILAEDRIWFGSNHSGFAPLIGFNLDGQIENVRIYHRGLPLADITHLHDYPALTTYTAGAGTYAGPANGTVRMEFWQHGVTGAFAGNGGGGYARINSHPTGSTGQSIAYQVPISNATGFLFGSSLPFLGTFYSFSSNTNPTAGTAGPIGGIGGTVFAVNKPLSVSFKGGDGAVANSGGGSSAGIAAVGTIGSGTNGGVAPLGGGNGGNVGVDGFAPGGGGGSTAANGGSGKIRILFTPNNFNALLGGGSGGRILQGLSLAL